MATNLLEARDVHKRFGGIHALRGVSVSVEEHSITGLIGPNGSGKTTFFNTVTGFVRPDEGSVRFRGTEIARLPGHRVVDLGLARTFQNPADFPSLSVAENLLAGGRDHPGDSLLRSIFTPGQARRRERDLIDRAWQVMGQLGLTALANASADALSIGENRLLQLGRQLMTEPSMLLLDEPTSGLNPEYQLKLGELIQRLRDEQGMTFLIIEHNLSFIRSVTEKLYVMHLGEVIASGQPDDVARDPAVIETYLGGSYDAA
jgi:ABC-type branched-subunit amino acid transport system ATPase component